MGSRFAAVSCGFSIVAVLLGANPPVSTAERPPPSLDFVVYGADFDPDTDTTLLAGGVHRFTWGFELSARLGPRLGLGLLFTDVEQLCDTPPVDWPSLGTPDDRMSVSTTGFDLSGVAPWPLGRLEPYLRGGAGVHRTRLRITGQVLGLPQALEEADIGFGTHAGLGLIVRLGRWRVHGEHRRTWLTGDLPRYGGGSGKLGGSMLAFGVGARL